jgi:hypothetical protein
MTEHNETVGQGPAMLDIGGDIGALVLYTPAELLGAEMHIAALDDPAHHAHSQVHRRTINGRTVYAAVYPQLPRGRYGLTSHEPGGPSQITITGGHVTEHHWRGDQ